MATSQLPMIDLREHVVHHVLVDSSRRSASDSNNEYRTYLGKEGILKNIIGMSLLSAVIPHTDDNVRADANIVRMVEYYVQEGVIRYTTCTVQPGFYASDANFRLAARVAFTVGTRSPPLYSPSDRPVYEVNMLENGHCQIRVGPGSTGKEVHIVPVFDDDKRSVLYKLGFDSAHPGSVPIDPDSIRSSAKASWISNRLVDISTTDYVDIDILELPSAALKLTGENRRVFARVPLTRNLSRTVRDVSDRSTLRRLFYPINLETITIRLTDQYGTPFHNNNADHTLDLEIICLGPPPSPTTNPPYTHIEVSSPETQSSSSDTSDETTNQLATRRDSVLSFKSAVISGTLALFGGLVYIARRRRLRRLSQSQTSYGVERVFV